MKYEYKFTEFMLSRSVKQSEELLNALGTQGWEIAYVWPEVKGQVTVARVLLTRQVYEFLPQDTWLSRAFLWFNEYWPIVAAGLVWLAFMLLAIFEGTEG